MQEKQVHINRLIEACKKGDQTAQFEIYKLYYKAMYNAALRILKDNYEAEDVMQEAFLNAFTKLDMYKGEVAFGAWLKKIVVNKCLTQLKKNNRFQEVKLEVVERGLESEEDTESKDYLDYSAVKANKVIETMEKLKENYRLVLTLSLIEGYDNNEISEIMKISNENCRTTISRAKNKLRKLLAEEVLTN